MKCVCNFGGSGGDFRGKQNALAANSDEKDISGHLVYSAFLGQIRRQRPSSVPRFAQNPYGFARNNVDHRNVPPKHLSRKRFCCQC